jgi:hypothetical protein
MATHAFIFRDDPTVMTDPTAPSDWSALLGDLGQRKPAFDAATSGLLGSVGNTASAALSFARSGETRRDLISPDATQANYWQPELRLAGDVIPRKLWPWESGQAGLGYGGGSFGSGGLSTGGRPVASFGEAVARGGAAFSAIQWRKIDEAECVAQYERDIFHCKMVGLPECYAQAAERYAACLAGRPIPPLNY